MDLECPLLGVKQTYPGFRLKSEFDPKSDIATAVFVRSGTFQIASEWVVLTSFAEIEARVEIIGVAC